MQEPKLKTWIVTGASGRVGRMVFRHWQRNAPQRVKFVPQFRSPSQQGLFWDIESGPQALLDWIANHGAIDGVLVLSGVTPSAQLPDMSLNLKIIQGIIHAVQAAGVPRLLVASSSAVYGNWSDERYLESAPLRPISAYGRAKTDVETACHHAQGPDLVISCLRIGNVAGADALLGVSHRTMIELDQFIDGHGPIRSYVGGETLADIFADLACALPPLPSAINIAAPEPVTMRALVEAAKLPWRFVPAGAGATQSVTLNTERLCALIKLEAVTSSPAEMVRQWHALQGAQ